MQSFFLDLFLEGSQPSKDFLQYEEDVIKGTWFLLRNNWFGDFCNLLKRFEVAYGFRIFKFNFNLGTGKACNKLFFFKYKKYINNLV
jgi:hypothetical protein